MEFSGESPTVDLTYSDVFLVPRRSAVTSRLQVDLAPQDGTPATLPLVASNMNSVTGPRLAAVLARRGGLGVLPQDMPLQDLDGAIRDVKAQPVLWDTPIVLPPEASVADALRLMPPTAGHGIVVARGAAPHDVEQILGVLPATRLATALPDAQLGDLVHSGTPSLDADDIGSERHAFDVITDAGAEMVTIVHHGHLVGTLSARSALRSTLYRPALDRDGRLAVAAAVGINGDVAAKAKALASAGVDVLVVDTAHGHQDKMLDALPLVVAARDAHEAATGRRVPVAAGNVVSADGVRDLVAAGADIVKVGVGPGAMCTTRMMTGVGRPQFSAVLECAEAARGLGAHVWADGGVRYPRDVALALAAGAASVMIGSWFAGTLESPGDLKVGPDGRPYKESFGMASARAVSNRTRDAAGFERARMALFEEGISSSRMFLDPDRPGVEDLVDQIIAGVRSSATYAGARSIAQFHDRAVVGLQSSAGYDEGRPLHASW